VAIETNVIYGVATSR